MSFAIGDLIQQRLPHLRTYARFLTRNRAAAEDLVQDTIVRVLASIERFDGTSFTAWSNTILRNRFLDDCRRSRFHGGSIDDLPVTATARDPTQGFVVELDETLRALDDLSPKHRKILVMVCIKEFSYARTARRLKIPLGTVRSRLSRARAELLAVVEGTRSARRNVEVRRTQRRHSATESARACA